MSIQNKNGKKRSRSNETLKPLSFSASPDEIERWKANAEKDRRTLSWWIRNRLLAMDAAENAGQFAESGEKA